MFVVRKSCSREERRIIEGRREGGRVCVGVVVVVVPGMTKPLNNYVANGTRNHTTNAHENPRSTGSEL